MRTLHGGRYPLMRYGQRLGGVRYERAGVRVDRRRPARRARARRACATRRRARLQARWAVGHALLGRRAEAQRRAALSLPAARRAAAAGPLHAARLRSSTRLRDYAFGDRAILRDGLVMATFAAARRRASRSSCSAARAAARSLPSTAFGLAEYRVALGAARARGGWTSSCRREPVPDGTPAALELRAAPFAAHRDAMLRALAGDVRAARCSSALPERRVQDAYYASLMHILLPRYQLPDGDWVQPVNKLRYHAFWLRDASIMTQALDLAGLHREAGENLGFFDRWQHDDGQFISREGQLDGHGQAMWAIGEHALRSRDREFARDALPVARARRRLARARARARDALGLVPPSDPRDNELVAGHLAGDDFWAVAGLRGGGRRRADARRRRARGGRGRAELGGAARDRARARRASAAARNGGAIPPALDRDGGRDWGNLWAAWPAPVLDPTSPLVTRTLAARPRPLPRGARDVRRVSQPAPLPRLPRLADRAAARRAGARRAGPVRLARAHDEHERRLRDRRAAVRAALGRRQPRAARLVRRRARRAAAQHARARVAAAGLELLSALPARWLEPGRPTVVRDAPTTLGHGRRVAAARARRRGADVERAAVPAGTPLWWRVPAAARGVRAPGLAAGADDAAAAGPRGRAADRLAPAAPQLVVRRRDGGAAEGLPRARAEAAGVRPPRARRSRLSSRHRPATRSGAHGSSRWEGRDRHGLGARDRPRDGGAALRARRERPHQRPRRRPRRADRVGDRRRDGRPRRRPDRAGACDALVQTAIDAWGKLDIIVNNAGYTIDGMVHKMTDEQFQRMLDIHAVVPFRVCRAAAPHLREPAKQEREQGVEVFRKIVNVSSISGTMGNAGQANYAAGKAAVVGLTKTLAKEWGQFKINVNAVAFGFIDTRLTAAKVEDNTMQIGGETVQLGIPEQMRGMSSLRHPARPPGHGRRRPPAASSSSARRGRTTSTARR